jgi:hypothetical protein
MDNAPSIPRMKREIQEARIQLERRRPPAPSEDLVDMLDGKLTNFISDLQKTDPKYVEKREYFKDLIWAGKDMLPNAAATFERKGHGTPYTMSRIWEEAAAARQSASERTLPPYVSNGGKKKKTLKRRHRKTRRHRRTLRR